MPFMKNNLILYYRYLLLYHPLQYVGHQSILTVSIKHMQKSYYEAYINYHALVHALHQIPYVHTLN